MANTSEALGSRLQPIVIPSSPTEQDFSDDTSSIVSMTGSREATLETESLQRPRSWMLSSFPPLDREFLLSEDHQRDIVQRNTPSLASGSSDLLSDDSDNCDELIHYLEHKLRKMKRKHQRLRKNIAKDATILRGQRDASSDGRKVTYRCMEQLQKDLVDGAADYMKILARHEKLQEWQARHRDKESRLRAQIRELRIKQNLPEELQPFECSICSYNRCDAETKCGHSFCWPCLIEWYDTQREQSLDHTCPYCRERLGDKGCSMRGFAVQLRW